MSIQYVFEKLNLNYLKAMSRNKVTVVLSALVLLGFITIISSLWFKSYSANANSLSDTIESPSTDKREAENLEDDIDSKNDTQSSFTGFISHVFGGNEEWSTPTPTTVPENANSSEASNTPSASPPKSQTQKSSSVSATPTVTPSVTPKQLSPTHTVQPTKTPTQVPTDAPTQTPVPSEPESSSIDINLNSSSQAVSSGHGSVSGQVKRNTNGYWDFNVSGTFTNLQPNRRYQLWFCGTNCSSNSSSRFTSDGQGSGSFSNVTIGHAQGNDPINRVVLWEQPENGSEILENNTTCYQVSINSTPCLSQGMSF